MGRKVSNHGVSGCFMVYMQLLQGSSLDCTLLTVYSTGMAVSHVQWHSMWDVPIPIGTIVHLELETHNNYNNLYSTLQCNY